MTLRASCAGALAAVALLTAAPALAQDAPVVLPDSVVNVHSPYLQLGQGIAPDSEFDQVQIIWQNRVFPGFEGENTVEYRLKESTDDWTDVTDDMNCSPTTGDSNRINCAVTIPNLLWKTRYEYRVLFKGFPEFGAERYYFNTFRTRLQVGDTTPFTFAAYGDSAGTSGGAAFQYHYNLVSERVLELDPDFLITNGDNAYLLGLQSDYDGRMSDILAPAGSRVNAKMIQFAAFGNHDVLGDAAGMATVENFDVPISELPCEDCQPERFYSYDWGTTHFATIDGNTYQDPEALEKYLDWLKLDMMSVDESKIKWKVLFQHFCIAGCLDKPESAAGNFYTRMVEVSNEVGIDLILTGHSHTYARTWPLLGSDGTDEALHVPEGDTLTKERYPKGVGVTHIVAGTGGATFVEQPGSDSAPHAYHAFQSQRTLTQDQHGTNYFKVTEDTLEVTFITTAGEEHDKFTIDRTLAKPAQFTGFPGQEAVMAANTASSVSSTSSSSPLMYVGAGVVGGLAVVGGVVMAARAKFAANRGKFAKNRENMHNMA